MVCSMATPSTSNASIARLVLSLMYSQPPTQSGPASIALFSWLMMVQAMRVMHSMHSMHSNVCALYNTAGRFLIASFY